MRVRMRAVRDRLSPEERRGRAARMEDRLFAIEAIGRARTVFVFSSFGAEIPTDGIVRRLSSEGRRVAIPYVERGLMHAGELHADEPLVPSGHGPSEPRSRRPVDPRDVDAVIVPGLAFDRDGFRLGYGGGHYDRYLRRLGPEAARVGIAFHVQLVEAVPHGRRDERVDFVVTEEETVDCRPRR